MRGVAVIEEVEDAFTFHQPGDKVEGAFSILHTKLPRVVGLGGGVLEICKAEIRENFLDDVEGALVLEDLVVGIHGEQPEPGIDISKIGSEARRLPCLGKP